MKRGDEGESHKVGNGRKSGMVKITIMKKEKGVEEERMPSVACTAGRAQTCWSSLYSRSHLQLGASTAFLLGQFEPVASYHQNSLSRNHSSSTLVPLGNYKTPFSRPSLDASPHLRHAPHHPAEIGVIGSP
jgi:hypothetical protein